MQSPLVIVLRASVLLGCLGLLPLMAAGGLSAPEKICALGQTWLARHASSEPLLAPRTIQVELPADALRYREVGSPIELSWDDSTEDASTDLELAEVMPASYEKILPPATSGAIATRWEQSWSPTVLDTLPSRLARDEQIFETGARTEPPATATLAEVEARLRNLGASDVRLEPWGSAGQLYRYCAVVPVAGSAEVERHFQSIGSSPDRAALEVLAQVTASARQ